jgi:hypothetical protein
MRALMSLMPDDASVIAAEIRSGQDAKAVIEARSEQARALRKVARVAARKGKQSLQN